MPSEVSLQGMQPRATVWILAICVAGLLAIWPLLGTMAIRNSFYLLGLLALAWMQRSWTWAQWRTRYRAIWPLGLFYAWLIFHNLFLAHDPSAEHHELGGFWLRCGCAALLGLGIGDWIRETQQQYEFRPSNQRSAGLMSGPERLLKVSLYGALVSYLVRYGYEVVRTGRWLHTDFFMTPLGGKPQVVVFTTILITAVFAMLPEIKPCASNRRGLFLAVGTVLSCWFVLYTANTKNGFLLFLMMLAALIAQNFWAHRLKPKVIVALLSLVLAVGAVAYRQAQTNSAWSTMLQDVAVGLDIEHQEYWRNWIDHELPLNASGLPVKQSAYLRTAWFTAASQLILENPAGYGLMSYSFTYLAREKWPDFYRGTEHMVATHSGWMDLTLGLGLPALLVFQFCWWRSFVRARKADTFWHRYIRWTVPTLTFAYLTVEVSYDIFFELLFLYAAMFAAITHNLPVPKSSLREPRIG